MAVTVRMTPAAHDVLRLFSAKNQVRIDDIVWQAIKKFFLERADDEFETGASALRDEFGLEEIRNHLVRS